MELQDVLNLLPKRVRLEIEEERAAEAAEKARLAEAQEAERVAALVALQKASAKAAPALRDAARRTKDAARLLIRAADAEAEVRLDAHNRGLELPPPGLPDYCVNSALRQHAEQE